MTTQEKFLPKASWAHHPAESGAVSLPLPDAGSAAGDPLKSHKEARRQLAAELANYQEVLVPDLQTILSAKTVVTAQAEETKDLDKLDQLSIRIRNLELREKVASQKGRGNDKRFASSSREWANDCCD